ncbi:MAG TPA: hypothetical protein H9848_12355 [Candidatus Parabacteroides intestinigallinarum]|uniref:Uncharacterized protein n=1 Tax=Candidatus Parabacteroides intestinigallinarum TaxID=2838722 RepID=A0A9D1XTK0_9BACT|nr:hypothetical protein [Candidatus Parabacteroides intestinigallinarum]
MDKKEINKAMTHGIVFKKAKEEGDARVRFSDFLRGTHGSDSAKWKAGFKYKKALRNTRKKK